MQLEPLSEHACLRALEARDPRFDGVFFVGITSTRIYCRPICPARVSNPMNRRFFRNAAAAEFAGFRPCRRCRPELAPGNALVDSVSRIARAAAMRISAGALNGRPVAALARELCVSERHLRRALERELGVAPLALAQTQRLLLAKRLLTDTQLPVTDVAFASGFQSLRRFNTVFRECYRMRPSDCRREQGARTTDAGSSLRLTLSYREPFDWTGLLAVIDRATLPGVEAVEHDRYMCAIAHAGHRGVVVAQPMPAATPCLEVSVSRTLLPALMSVMARLRRLFDLDAEPAIVNAAFASDPRLGPLVHARPGLRVPGAIDGFAVAVATMIERAAAGKLVEAFGQPLESGLPAIAYTAPEPEQIARCDINMLVKLGVPNPEAAGLIALASAVCTGEISLEPGADADATWRALVGLPGVSERVASLIVMRAMSWPDAFPCTDRSLRIEAGRWRPWRAYAASYLGC